MATNRNLIFRYVLEIRDVLTKNKQVEQSFQGMKKQATNAGNAVDNAGNQIKNSSEKSAAAAVNFQT